MGATDDAERLCDSADGLQEAGDFAKAVEVYRQALALAPQCARAWYACGCAETARQEFPVAGACFERALELCPEWLEARHNLARACYELGQADCAFSEFQQCGARAEENSRLARAMMAMIVPGVPQAGNQTVLDVRRAWAEGIRPERLERETGGVPGGDERLKIGYVSSFFDSKNWMKPVWGLVNEHDRRVFEVYLFADATKSAIQHGYNADPADRFFDTSELTNAGLAKLIRECGIQVLVDLNGYSNIQRLPLFLLRPAPAIVGWFNMYATTGMRCFDCLVGDHVVIPVEEEMFYSEKIERVTGSYLTFRVDYPVPPVAELPWLRNGFATFGCFGSQYKITSPVVEAWSGVLKQTPGSVFLLKNKQMRSAAAREFVRGLFAQCGVKAERVLLEGPADHFEFLKAYDRIDIALDTFPYNGGTTTTEALWQGVPVVSFRGDRWASRTSASILLAGGLGEFVAGDVAGFIALASGLANLPAGQQQRLAGLRRNMRERLLASSVCDTKKFARQMEAIYQRCWEARALPGMPRSN